MSIRPTSLGRFSDFSILVVLFVGLMMASGAAISMISYVVGIVDSVRRLVMKKWIEAGNESLGIEG